MNIVTGILKFFDSKKGFGIVTTAVGDVFLHRSKAGDFVNVLTDGAKVTMDVMTTYEKSAYKRSAVSVQNVTEPKSVRCFATVKWYNADKGFGFATVVDGEFAGKDAYLSRSVCGDVGILPAENMPMLAIVAEKQVGRLAVISFVSNEEVAADFANFIAKTMADTADAVVEMEAESPKPKAKPARVKKAKPVDIAEMAGKSEGDTALADAMKKALNGSGGSAAHH